MVKSILFRWKFNIIEIVTAILLFSQCTTIMLYSQQKTGKITVQANGFKSSKGKARLLLFNEKEKKGFPMDIDKAMERVVVPIKQNKVIYTFENIPFGNYAVSVHHDEDDNDKVNTNFLGIPKESLGSSNDAKGNFGPPSFDKAKITLDKEELSIIINMVN